MIAETSIVEKYARSGIEARLNFVLEHFDGMMELVDFFEKDLCERIREDKLFNRRQLTGNTGIRVQTSGLSDTTFRDAERNVSMIQQIRSGSIDSCQGSKGSRITMEGYGYVKSNRNSKPERRSRKDRRGKQFKRRACHEWNPTPQD